MADDVDRANDRQEAALSRRIEAARAGLAGESLGECIECGNKIPEARRSLGGVTLCVECAIKHERMDSLHRGNAGGW